MLLISLINIISVLIFIAGIIYFLMSRRQQPEITQTTAPEAPLSKRLTLKALYNPGIPIDRGHYLLFGVILFALKYNLDRAIAGFIFHRTWTPLNYVSPLYDLSRPFLFNKSITEAITQNESTLQFYFVIAIIAVPFIWAGISLTINRLRDLKVSPGWALLFFVPFINYLLFLVLSILPGSQQTPPHSSKVKWLNLLDSIIPENALGSALLGILVTMIPSTIALFGATHSGLYGLGLFLGLPFCIGMISVLIYGYRCPRNFAECMGVAAIATFLQGLIILILAFEGIICLFMAAPIAITLGLLGGAAGYALQARPNRTQRDTMMTIFALILSWPLFTGAESQLTDRPPVYAVESIMEINAPPETVWNNVVTFSQLPEPTEWIFHTGIAYPIRAEIQGRGVGAVRHCIFSTGEFVEPIEVWDEPRRLGFGVKTMPMPMHEFSYKKIHPPHLDQYLQVTHGEFLLEPLPGNRTKLIGTTWYSNKVWPSYYWKVWSDGIIHAIHLRVLRHIKDLSEA